MQLLILSSSPRFKCSATNFDIKSCNSLCFTNLNEKKTHRPRSHVRQISVSGWFHPKMAQPCRWFLIYFCSYLGWLHASDILLHRKCVIFYTWMTVTTPATPEVDRCSHWWKPMVKITLVDGSLDHHSDYGNPWNMVSRVLLFSRNVFF